MMQNVVSKDRRVNCQMSKWAATKGRILCSVLINKLE